jgi:hypothetical protein
MASVVSDSLNIGDSPFSFRDVYLDGAETNSLNESASVVLFADRDRALSDTLSFSTGATWVKWKPTSTFRIPAAHSAFAVLAQSPLISASVPRLFEVPLIDRLFSERSLLRLFVYDEGDQ